MPCPEGLQQLQGCQVTCKNWVCEEACWIALHEACVNQRCMPTFVPDQRKFLRKCQRQNTKVVGDMQTQIFTILAIALCGTYQVKQVAEILRPLWMDVLCMHMAKHHAVWRLSDYGRFEQIPRPCNQDPCCLISAGHEHVDEPIEHGSGNGKACSSNITTSQQ